MPHRALITGVSGFVGGHLAQHLLGCGDQVLGTSPDGRWMDSPPPSLAGRVGLLAWDIGRADGLSDPGRQQIERFRPEVIYHLAAISVPRECGDDEPSPRAMSINVDGTRRVLDLAAALPTAPRVVFISSSHVYAPVTREAPRVDEGSPLGPCRAYGRTKLAAEHEVRRASNTGVDAVIVRAFQHTGPGQRPPMMLPEWAQQFAGGGSQPVTVHTLDAWIDLSDVRDVVRAYRLLAERGQTGEVYNVGTGVARRSGEIFDVLRRQADPQRPIVELRPGVKRDPIANIARLVAQTGWRPEVGLEQTVADIWRAVSGTRVQEAGVRKQETGNRR